MCRPLLALIVLYSSFCSEDALHAIKYHQIFQTKQMHIHTMHAEESEMLEYWSPTRNCRSDQVD
jgi:hypothetical protein